ncbi:MAG: hypothetical protein SFW64_07310 [Alphaproteobacteria bacterium]|nr:hypothetical protein [Alphaproteobacteria bacterium]
MSENPSPFTQQEQHILKENIAIVGGVMTDTVEDLGKALRAQEAAIVATVPDQKQPHGAHKSPALSQEQWAKRQEARKITAFEAGDLTEQIADNVINGLTPEAERRVAAAQNRADALGEKITAAAPGREARLNEAIEGINVVFELHGIPKVGEETSRAESQSPSSNPGKSPAVAPGSHNL